MSQIPPDEAALTLLNALRERSPRVQLTTDQNVRDLLERVYDMEPALRGCVTSMRVMEVPGILSHRRHYALELLYAGQASSAADDGGAWDLQSVLSRKRPLDTLTLVTADPNALSVRIDADMNRLREENPGLNGFSISAMTLPLNSGYRAKVKFTYTLSDGEMARLRAETDRALEQIERRWMGQGRVPQVVRAFQAFAYLQLHCEYDDEGAALITAGHPENLPRPWVTLPYGPLVRGQGICSGISQAYKAFMDRWNIPCRVVFGKGRESGAGHAWNMVQLGGRFYHVCATFDISRPGVCLKTFLKTDAEMKSYYDWDAAAYPACTARAMDYDHVRDYIDEHRAPLQAAGADASLLDARVYE